MGFIGSILGGGGGSDWQASGTRLDEPTYTDQAKLGYARAEWGVDAQRDLMNALAAQGGLQHQQDQYNAVANLAQGVGPNPAQAALNQATGQNIASQAALMAGQRGASANAGLMARQAAQQGGNLQQQAVGQGATLQAQQQLAAMQQAQAMANQQVAQQQQGVAGYNAAAQQQYQTLLNSINQQNQNRIQMQSNMNNANSGVQQQNAKTQGGIFGGLMNAAGGALGLMNRGGMVPKNFADGGMASGMTPPFVPGSTAPQANVGKPKSAVAQFFSDMTAPMMAADDAAAMNMAKAGTKIGQGIANLFAPTPQAAPNPFLGADGMGGFNPYANADGMGGGFAKGGNVGDKMKAGGKVPGKAAVKGDSVKNDTVSAKLSPGEIVIPRSVVNSEDPVKNAAKFVEAVLAKHSMKK